jgi:hypothetical protein
MRRAALALAVAAIPFLVPSPRVAARQSAAIDISGFGAGLEWRNIGPALGDRETPISADRVTADADFPYRVCSNQSGGGAVCVASRGESGAITIRDWHPLAFDNGSGIAADPNDPNIVIGGRLARYDRRTGQTHDVRPPPGEFSRAGQRAPVLYPPAESRALLYGANAIWRSIDNGDHWTRISGDLSRGGAVSAIAASAVDPEVIWAGTDDGLIHVTRDAGKTWTNVTPPDVMAPMSVSQLDASHFDIRSAYAAIGAPGSDDRRPRLYRTRDNGQTWVDIARGLPAATTVHVVREDPVRRGLLFAGTAESVFVSFDDGDSWQPLTFNLPTTSVLDVVVKGDDLIAGTAGRGIWILDDMTPLRQITADVMNRAGTFLFRPATAWRVRPRADRLAGPASGELSRPNPPRGATINYLIGDAVTGPVTLEIIEYPPSPTTAPSIVPGRPSGRGNGRVIRRYSSDANGDAGIPVTPGFHRVVWDLAAERALGPLALPGAYTVRLTVNGRAYAQALILRQDPRVRTSIADLSLQYTLSRRLVELMDQLRMARDGAASERRAVIDAASAPLPDLYARLQDADARPTAALEAELTDAIARAERALAGGPIA